MPGIPCPGVGWLGCLPGWLAGWLAERWLADGCHREIHSASLSAFSKDHNVECSGLGT